MIGWLSQLHVSTLSASAIHKRPQPAKPTDGAESPPGCVCSVSRGDERTHDQHTGVTGSLSSTPVFPPAQSQQPLTQHRADSISYIICLSSQQSLIMI